MLDNLGLVITVAIPVIGALIVLNSFMKDNRGEHRKLMEGIGQIATDCTKSNEECRRELKQSQKEFILTLKDMIGERDDIRRST